jgi:CheY-like chemotaxis protein
MSKGTVALRQRHLEASVTALARKRKTVLIVDDSPVNRKIAAMHMRSLGYDVDLAIDANEALDKSDNQAFDVIIMDVQLPELTGLDCTLYIRWRDRHKKRPIIFGWSTTATREACINAGMDAILPKPLNVVSLCKSLAQFHELN